MKNTIALLTLIAITTVNAQVCHRLAENQSHSFEDDYVRPPVGQIIAARYLLVRNRDRVLTEDFRDDRWQNSPKVPKGTKVPDYEAVVRIKFVNEKGLKDDKLSTEMIGRMNACINSVNSSLRGPLGEYLKLTQWTEKSVHPKPIGHFVFVHEDFPRANSMAWEREEQCQTIIHELMHVLGLVDEYQDEDFPIRNIGEEASIMSFHRLGFERSKIVGLRSIWSNKRRNLLAPAQFLEITEKGCTDVNPLYAKCSEGSYEQKILEGGPRGPNECRDPQWITKYNRKKLLQLRYNKSVL
jgi:hypothetical protein